MRVQCVECRIEFERKKTDDKRGKLTTGEKRWEVKVNMSRVLFGKSKIVSTEKVKKGKCKNLQISLVCMLYIVFSYLYKYVTVYVCIRY